MKCLEETVFTNVPALSCGNKTISKSIGVTELSFDRE